MVLRKKIQKHEGKIKNRLICLSIGSKQEFLYYSQTFLRLEQSKVTTHQQKSKPAT